jgi:hypothetical protein
MKYTALAWCDCEGVWMILLQTYLYTYSLLRGVTLEVLLLSNYYAFSPMMLPFKADFIFGNSQKSFRAIWGK